MERVCTSSDQHGTEYSTALPDMPGALVTWAAIILIITPSLAALSRRPGALQVPSDAAC
ncbi:hypothetical protein [Streptomyces sp. HC307]|uniref:hypothetical protein n=1 Tax=Streptomyces flavusporus TaxID=3385496 RepID=UPI003916D9B4